MDEYEDAWREWSKDLPPDVVSDARVAWEKTIEASMLKARLAWLDALEPLAKRLRRNREDV